MKIAVLGLGFMGSTHLKALLGIRGVKVAGVYSSDEKKLSGDLTSVQGSIGGAPGRVDLAGVRKFRDLEPLLADPEIDAVDICLPSYLHELVALEALRAGKHVLVEKPMALDGFGADRMVNAARKHKRILMAAHVIRFLPEYTALGKAIQQRQLGQVRFAVFRRRCAMPGGSEWLKDPSQSGGGAFDLLIHDADLCLRLFGKPQTVSASGYADPAAGIDCLHAQLQYEHGGSVLITGGWHQTGAYPSSMEYTVTLDGGTVEFCSAGRPPTLYSPDGAELALGVNACDGYAAELEYFVECCREGREPELCPPRESADAVKLMALLLEGRDRNGAKMLCNI
jgi:predicted dehydrogenase